MCLRAVARLSPRILPVGCSWPLQIQFSVKIKCWGHWKRSVEKLTGFSVSSSSFLRGKKRIRTVPSISLGKHLGFGLANTLKLHSNLAVTLMAKSLLCLAKSIDSH